MTAHALAHDVYAVQPGDDVLVHAAAGGLGLLLTQLATARGAPGDRHRVHAEKEELARGAGAAEVVRYTEVDDLAAPCARSPAGPGSRWPTTASGATTFDASLAALRRRGMLRALRGLERARPPVDPQRLNAAGSAYLDPAEAVRLHRHPGRAASRAAAVYGAVVDGSLDVRIGGRYPLADARTAHSGPAGPPHDRESCSLVPLNPPC
jgi:NADPH2:quinone reductase